MLLVIFIPLLYLPLVASETLILQVSQHVNEQEHIISGSDENHQPEKEIQTQEPSAPCQSYTVKEGSSGSVAVGSTEYANASYCEWLLETPEGTTIDITFERFDLDENCSAVFLEIFDVPSLQSLTEKMCGTFVPSSISSSTNQVLIRFSTAGSISHTGFALNYIAVDAPVAPKMDALPSCRYLTTIYTKELSGSIAVGPLSNEYDNDLSCIWLFMDLGNKVAEITFERFDLDGNCSSDYLEFVNYVTGVSLTGKMCGNSIPPPISPLIKDLWIRFKTDGSNTNGGFTFNYTLVDLPPQGTVNACDSLPGVVGTTFRGSLTVGSSSNEYDNNLDCEWIIKTNKNNALYIAFERFDLQQNCSSDYLEIFDVPTLKSLSGKLCGNSLPSYIISLRNQVLIHFKTDNSVSGSGFHLTYMTISVTGTIYQLALEDAVTSCPLETDLEEEGSMRKITGYTNVEFMQDTNDGYCEWLMETPEGTAINITSGIEIYEGNTSTFSLEYFDLSSFESLTGKMSAGSVPSPVSSSSNRVLVRFIQHYFTDIYFELVYTAIAPTPRLCEGLEVLNALSTPSNLTVWSETPTGNVFECLWLLKAPLNNVIQINLTQIEVGSCNSSAFVAIEDEGNLRTEYCESGALESYTSVRNYVWISLSTVGYWSTQGFSLQYIAIPLTEL